MQINEQISNWVETNSIIMLLPTKGINNLDCFSLKQQPVFSIPKLHLV